VRRLPLEVQLAAPAAALVVLAFVFARTGIPPWIPPAPLVLAGVASPFSGMTRSFVALASGDLGTAFAWHPLGPPLFAACVAGPVLAALSVTRGRPRVLRRLARSRAVWAVVALAFTAAWARQIAVLG
jgi:hypothetical protein